MAQIIQAKFPEHISVIKKLFTEYQKELGFDLCFQGFKEELATLPGEYKNPNGSLILLFDAENEKYIGCIALKKHESHICEMKRLF